MESSKKILLTTIFIALLIVLATGITFAFFNYTRTGVANSIRVGRIYFNTSQSDTINLTNVFPISRNEATGENTNYGEVVIEIQGDTDYSEGIEYLVSSVDSSLIISGKTIPISLNIEVDDLGTENNNYFTARDNTNTSIYKKLVGGAIIGDQMLLVGYIKPNTTSGTAEGIDGSITIKAYLNKDKIGISDTYPSSDVTHTESSGETSIEVFDYTNDTTDEWANGRTILTTSEWNALQQNGVSFKVKVEANEGIWVNQPLYDIIKVKNLNTTTNQPIMDNEASEFVSASTGINFGAKSSDTNGKGVYMRAGTENDSYPIMYYRGEVTDNNVVFANQCWKTVRTTDTGGVKLIYNGKGQTIITYEHNDLISNSDITYTNDSTYPYTYDVVAKTWTSTNHVDDTTGIITFSVNEAGNYGIEYDISSEEIWDKAKFYKNNILLKETSGEESEIVNLGQLATTDVIKVEYTKDYAANTSSGNDNVVFSVLKQYGNYTQTVICNSTNTDTHISLDVSGTPTNMFAFNTNYNSPAYNGYMYGDVYTRNSSNWTSGARFGSSFTWDGTNYTLVDDEATTPNTTHHYSCNSSNAGSTCTDLRYVFYWYSSSSLNYNTYYIILQNGKSVEDALREMQTNTNDSNAKAKIDTWYASNLAAYTNKLEDTIWCNDRSFGDNTNNGWIANGGELNIDLFYGAYQRSAYALNTSTVKNQPSLVCANKNDRFTVSNANGNQALTYPVAMITEDEVVLAGGLAGIQNTTFYLNNGSYYWSLSPTFFNTNVAYEFYVGSDSLSNNYVDSTYGIRPVVSLKFGTPVVSGDGTENNPYVIE